jgi:hypothetical protein
MLQDDLQNHVAGVAAAVDDFFQKIVEIAQEDDLFCVVIAVVKIVEQLQLQFVGVAFDGLEMRVHFPGARDVGSFAQFFYHGEDRFGGLVEELEVFLEAASVEVRRENQDPLPDFLDGLWNFVERGRERLDIFALERRDERFAKLFGQFLGDAFVLAPAGDEFLEALGRLVVLELPEKVDQMVNAAVGLLGAGFEKIEKLFVVSQESSDREHEDSLVAGVAKSGQQISTLLVIYAWLLPR